MSMLVVCLYSLQKVEVPHLEEEEASDSEEDDKTHNNGEVFQCDMVIYCISGVSYFVV